MALWGECIQNYQCKQNYQTKAEVAPVSCSAPTLFSTSCDFTLDNRSSSRDLSSINLCLQNSALCQQHFLYEYILLGKVQVLNILLQLVLRQFCHIDPGKFSPAPASFLSISFRLSLKTDSAKKTPIWFPRKVTHGWIMWRVHVAKSISPKCCFAPTCHCHCICLLSYFFGQVMAKLILHKCQSSCASLSLCHFGHCHWKVCRCNCLRLQSFTKHQIGFYDS